MTEFPPSQTAPMPFRLQIDEAMRHTRRHFRAIYPQVAIPIAVLATAVGVAQALLMSRLTNDAAGVLQSPFWSLESVVITLLYLAVVVVAYLTMQVAAVDAVAGRPVDMGRAWRFALQPRVIGTALLSYLAVFASVLCCFFPVLYVGPLLAFVPTVMVEEGLFGTRAFRRSSELAGYSPTGKVMEATWVKILIFMIIVMAISYALAMVVSLPFVIPMYVDIFRAAASGEDPTGQMASWFWLQVPSQFLNALASTAVYLYMSFGISLFFFDTRGRKEGGDLAAAIDSVFVLPRQPSPGEPTF